MKNNRICDSKELSIDLFEGSIEDIRIRLTDLEGDFLNRGWNNLNIIWQSSSYDDEGLYVITGDRPITKQEITKRDKEKERKKKYNQKLQNQKKESEYREYVRLHKKFNEQPLPKQQNPILKPYEERQ